jgi:hypothetical protein
MSAHKDSEPENMTRPEPLPTSQLLIRLVESHPNGKMSIGDLIDGLGERAFSIILLILTLPLAIPGPPGLPTVFGIPLLLVTSQLWRGRAAPWFPESIRRRSFSKAALLATLRKIRPALARLEKISRPRVLWLTNQRGERWIGGFFFLCTLVLINPIPIPFSHLPLAIALAILSLGYVERDGAVILIGAFAALIGIAVNISLVGGVLVLGTKLLHFM